ncbi:uncharacterized protein LOC114301539 [Camellia sinensis]|uniref:uncharacterized protein LOC114301539 n=1 Tax=Camellia sinensis TaxID=4442 RepID=UPI0010359D54|nr:uncharacterized protein LOC114301539 [Camellia sinensis]
MKRDKFYPELSSNKKELLPASLESSVINTYIYNEEIKVTNFSFEPEDVVEPKDVAFGIAIESSGKKSRRQRRRIPTVARAELWGDDDADGNGDQASINRQLHYNPNETIYFLEKDIKQGTKMNLDLSKEANGVTFLPRTVAQSMPFSSNEFPKILNRFSVKPNSAEAKIMKKTIEV